MNTSSIVQKLWNYCNVLRDDGMSYGDYPGSSPGQADNEAAPRQLLPALLYLLHPCSRAHPCARGIRTSLFSTVDVCPHPSPLPPGGEGIKGVMADERTRQLLCCTWTYECRVRAGARSGLRCPTFRQPWRSQGAIQPEEPGAGEVQLAESPHPNPLPPGEGKFL